jgi:hypothetical protein
MILLCDIAIAIATAFLELLIHILNLALSSSFLAHHSRGLKRWTYAVQALCSAHLFAGLVLPVLNDFEPYILSQLFSASAMLSSLIILLVALALPLAFDEAVARSDDFVEGNKVVEKVAERFQPPDALIYALSFALVMGLFALVSSQRERMNLREAACDLAGGRIGNALKDNGDEKVSMIERIARTNLIEKVSCPKEEG